jgi:ABC-type amino acid transport substrate-binding protein
MGSMTTRTVKIAALVVLACTLAACPPHIRETAIQATPPLRVGVTPDTPPMVFKQDGQIVGLEADFARQLAQDLGRPLEFVELPWEEQIPSLLRRHTDIIMSSMTATPERQVRIAFSNSYLDSGLMALTLKRNREKFETRQAVLDTPKDVGVRRGTTGEAFVHERLTKAQPVTYTNFKDAVIDLKRGRIDVFIDDSPMIVWLASENDTDFVLLKEQLARQPIAWGMRIDDVELRADVDGALRRWKSDGTRRLILERWLPYWPNLD